MTPLDALVGGTDAVGLDEILSGSALMTRTDRKYVLEPGDVAALLCELGPSVRVLEIDGKRSFGYESIYFDTPELDSYLGAARRRPDRFKVRTRRYVDQDTCWVEVKTRTRRGQNEKVRRRHDPADADRLTPDALAFVAATVDPATADRLEPVLRTRYRRTTLVVGDQRITIDADLRCDDLTGQAFGIGDRFVVETKSPGGPGTVDRALWRLGRRPLTISKFALGLAMSKPTLPRNKWHRVIDRYVVPDDSMVTSRRSA
ncbi:VTC domain-containing protein [Ilumatobacter fluminis]|uniref:VTC domain-containing protein n=1 Tax=Ilumatobacter fluminis TaxID=467091 RepID=A0A4R7I324_9ACTN|nr:polyphosphate polymerase domain-containing protein [Ilumatobacter fluminis]TDT17620.1 VTC domain-containing protein [Ilumatobacter fluminis]